LFLDIFALAFIVPREKIKHKLNMKSWLLASATLLCAACSNNIRMVTGASTIERRTTETYLDWIYDDLKKLYFDSTFGGVNLETQNVAARQRIQSLDSYNYLFPVLADFLATLRDSHTFFVPPNDINEFDYGFEMKMHGEAALVTHVKSGSSAEAEGLHKGDKVLSIDGHTVDRSTFDDLMYQYYVIAPRGGLTLSVANIHGAVRRLHVRTSVVQAPPGAHALMAVHPWLAAKLQRETDTLTARHTHHVTFVSEKVAVWKMPGFFFRDRSIEKIMREVRGADALVLDLRGNAGGAVQTLRDLVARVLPGEVLIGTSFTRGKTEAWRTKPSKDVFTGKLIVLIDYESASASEVFARLVQLNNRGVVVGDRSSGAVRTSITKTYTASNMTATASITVSDLIMADGKSLEGVGVYPNEMVIPKAQDIIDGRDPTLAYALSLVGLTLDSRAAATIHASK
jgi:C-terminal processing protease CtpA/Prc